MGPNEPEVSADVLAVRNVRDELEKSKHSMLTEQTALEANIEDVCCKLNAAMEYLRAFDPEFNKPERPLIELINDVVAVGSSVTTIDVQQRVVEQFGRHVSTQQLASFMKRSGQYTTSKQSRGPMLFYRTAASEPG